ncbi:DgyrCDS5326 [Dimorphilus gyrociliatus]|uniref:DgyrCDS5326 n=1 Tax=Dimorphilus gyrociliatus TaxID=2664684 RepID=A0A7I8VM92_9ANNE|nr:DgyrCDS5326 [Dimorphilus gyrociliatus]
MMTKTLGKYLSFLFIVCNVIVRGELDKEVQADVLASKAFGGSSPIESSCEAFIDKFAEAAANFTLCSILFASPIQICQSCSKQYLLANDYYQTILHGSPVDWKNRPCRDATLNLDRVHIVKQTGDYINNLWNNCFCSKCFEKALITKNGSLEIIVSNHTKHFQKLADNMLTCEWNTTSGNLSVCSHCNQQYTALNKLYEDLAEDTGEICMDIVDAVNRTRQRWSKDYKCSIRKRDHVAVIIISVIFALIPVVFYPAVYIHSSKKETDLNRRNVRQQSRRKRFSLF